jgi:protein-S-isoprenylcysteine O-methyltransferase Ste14
VPTESVSAFAQASTEAQPGSQPSSDNLISGCRRGWLRFRVPLGFAFAAWYLLIARPSSLSVLFICAVFAVIGCALRSWAAGYLFKGKRVAVGGPYAYVRNPLYLGSFILGIGFCVALWQQPLPASAIVLWAAFLLGYGVVYPAKSKAEEGELIHSLGEPYRNYAEQVPAFLPWRGRVSGLGEQRFSAELYRRNREYQCILGSAAVLIYLSARYLLAH